MFTVHLHTNVSNSLPTNALFSFIYCIFSTLLHVSVPQGHPQGVLTVNDQVLTKVLLQTFMNQTVTEF